MRKEVNAMGDTCPIPIVKTRNAIRELGAEGGCVVTYVDNEIAVQNLTKMAAQKGYGVNSEADGENQFKVTMQIPGNLPAVGRKNAVESAQNAVESAQNAGEGAQNAKEVQNAAPLCSPDSRKTNTVVVISSAGMGEGDDKLGSTLMSSYLYALSRQEELPDTILFYNGGAKITGNPSPVIEDLKSMEAEGVEILTCGTCLNYYGLADQLQVGTVTNMYTIAEKMMQASRIIKP